MSTPSVVISLHSLEVMHSPQTRRENLTALFLAVLVPVTWPCQGAHPRDADPPDPYLDPCMVWDRVLLVVSTVQWTGIQQKIL